MSELKAIYSTKSDQLKNHFTIRVSNQARSVLDLWANLHKDSASFENWQNLTNAAEKLLQFSQRFESTKFTQTAEQLFQILSSVKQDEYPKSQQLVI